jgi:hypothetical protein
MVQPRRHGILSPPHDAHACLMVLWRVVAFPARVVDKTFHPWFIPLRGDRRLARKQNDRTR